MAFAIRSSASPEATMNAVRQMFFEADSETPIDRLQPLGALLDYHLAQKRLAMTLLSLFSALALLLSAVGLYGVLSASVSQRMREFGIRSALGATRSDLVRLVLKEGLTLTAIGLVIGLACAPLATRTMKTMLYGVEPLDAGVLAAVAGILLLIAAVAILAPALRAARVDPVEALRDS